jgi:hypothetical protein
LHAYSAELSLKAQHAKINIKEQMGLELMNRLNEVGGLADDYAALSSARSGQLDSGRQMLGSARGLASGRRLDNFESDHHHSRKEADLTLSKQSLLKEV